MHVIVLHMDNFKARSVKSGNRETSSETRSPHPKPEMQEPPKPYGLRGQGISEHSCWDLPGTLLLGYWDRVLART